MSTNTETTYTVGYFNGNSYPINLVISSLNVILRVEPGIYIQDTLGRKINDPIFDAYKKLSKESSQTPVPLITIPAVKAVPVTTDGHSVHAVTEFRLNARGFREPVMPVPVPHAPVAVNASSSRGMSVQEAKRLGLIKTVRTVPEDYGVPDRDGPPVPVAELPPIKYAVDTARNPNTTSLPKGAAVLSDDSRTAKTAAARTQLQQALIEGQKTNEQLDSEVGFLNTVVPNVSALPAPPVTQTPVDDYPVEEAPAADPVQEVTTPALVAAAPVASALPAPVLDESAPARTAPQPLPPKRRYICAADGRTFDFRSQLVQHVARKYPHMAESLLKAYPPEAK